MLGMSQSNQNSAPYPLQNAINIQQDAADKGFEWPSPQQAFDKCTEELTEFKAAKTSEEKEFGDMLFALINYGRMHNIDCVKALMGANEKFITRFQKVETMIDISNSSLDEMLAAWRKAKKMD